MNEFDVDIRAVSGASYGARVTASDINQTSGGGLDSSAAQASASQASQVSDASGLDVTVSVQPQFRYDSFRFIYRSDYGRVVLVDQNPETGKAVSQIPSQRALQLYAEQKQAELRAAVGSTPSSAGGGASGTGHQGFSGLHTTKSAGTTSGLNAAAVSNTTTKASPSPNVVIPSPAYLNQTFSPVNITI
jgi:hypothetical protein